MPRVCQEYFCKTLHHFKNLATNWAGRTAKLWFKHVLFYPNIGWMPSASHLAFLLLSTIHSMSQKTMEMWRLSTFPRWFLSKMHILCLTVTSPRWFTLHDLHIWHILTHSEENQVASWNELAVGLANGIHCWILLASGSDHRMAPASRRRT